MFKARSMINSLQNRDEVIILHEKGSNDIIAEYNGKRCTAIYNAFVGLYYVDDIYGVLPDQHRCPNCGDYID